MGVSLFFGERHARLNALGGIRNSTIERSPACAEAEGSDHEAGIAEYQLRLDQPLTLDTAE